ncbi:hypothetical protein KJ359_011828 [Pestalotiopsis sp. 9143b]|nr:hypothetical protein KJ359_011828 [Pestalotiopsis sp. 9143b]
MSRKKNRGAKPITVEAKNPPKKSKIVTRWEDYFKEGNLEDWNRLMKDLGFVDEFPSITKCRKALKNVWVNIPDFLNGLASGKPTRHFPSQHELAAYTLKTGKVFPNKKIPKGSPLRRLLANIRQPSIGEKRVPEAEQVNTITVQELMEELCTDYTGLAIEVVSDSDSD